MADEGTPKLHIDDDWKAEAQREKERLAGKAKAAEPAAMAPGPPGAPGQSAAAGRKASGGGAPRSDFQTLLSTMVTQALFAMGAIPDPATGQRMAHLDLARHHIDMLTVIEEKTKGNLSQDESNMLATTLYELRNQYVQLAQHAREQALGGGASGAPRA